MRHRLLHLPAILAAACTASACGTAAPRTVAPQPAAALRPPQAFASSLGPLESAIRARLAAEAQGEFGVYVIDLETGRTAAVNPTLVMHAASTMKVGVLLELYRAAAAGELALEDSVAVTNRFRSLADTSHFTLPAGNDAALHALVGSRTTLRELARRMTVRSSNLATNILIDVVQPARVRETLARVQAVGMDVQRGVEDNVAFRAGLNNTTDAQGFAHALAAIARCDIVPPELCADMVSILLAQEINAMIPPGLPEGTRFAHKTGNVSGIDHDGGIVYPADSPPFVVVVLTRGARDRAAARSVGADIARLAWDALGPGGALRPRWSAETAGLLALHDRVRVSAFPAPTLRHDELWPALLPLVERSPLVTVERIGQSAEGRPLRLLSTGAGPVRVLFWSQMHGDETTASRALTDLFHYITTVDDARVRRWRDRLTILALPMLNPDGAEAHRRRSAFGIDINRDARLLSTPEGRALKAVQERFRPDFGFNLHDQNPRARAGSSTRTAAISLLAPAPDADATPTPGFTRARQLTAHLAGVVAPLIGDHLTRYDDSYNARAFGDGMQSWGVSTVLIETGSWDRDASKHYLRKVNFVALASALDAIADGTYDGVDVAAYTALPQNGRSLNDLLIRGGTVVLADMPTHRADIAIDAAAVGGPATTQIVDIGDLAGVLARDTVDAAGLFIHTAPGMRSLQPGQPPVLFLRRGLEGESELVWRVDGIRTTRYTTLGAPDGSE